MFKNYPTLTQREGQSIDCKLRRKAQPNESIIKRVKSTVKSVELAAISRSVSRTIARFRHSPRSLVQASVSDRSSKTDFAAAPNRRKPVAQPIDL